MRRTRRTPSSGKMKSGIDLPGFGAFWPTLFAASRATIRSTVAANSGLTRRTSSATAFSCSPSGASMSRLRSVASSRISAKVFSAIGLYSIWMKECRPRRPDRGGGGGGGKKLTTPTTTADGEAPGFLCRSPAANNAAIDSGKLLFAAGAPGGRGPPGPIIANDYPIERLDGIGLGRRHGAPMAHHRGAATSARLDRRTRWPTSRLLQAGGSRRRLPQWAHDIRNLLTTIGLHLDLLALTVGSPKGPRQRARRTR